MAEGDASRCWQFSVYKRHTRINKEMLLWCHSMVMTKLQMHQNLEINSTLE